MAFYTWPSDGKKWQKMLCSLIITSYFIRDFYGGKQFEGSYVDYAPGEVVVARYSVDLQWYRARVISSGDRKVEVQSKTVVQCIIYIHCFSTFVLK